MDFLLTFESFFTENPWGMALAGWLAFIILNLSMDKDLKDDSGQAFPLFPYIVTKWDNWATSLFFIPILVGLGKKALDLDTAELGFEWNNLYYFFVGIVPEFAKDKLSKFRNRNKS